ncbi:hypothetical protein FRC09_019330, partial [Ceratobasidium sp. 395]
MVQAHTDAHSTPLHAPVPPFHTNPGYLSPRTLAGTLDSWNDAVPSTRRSPSPTGVGSFVNKAKAMLRGKRNSLQATSADFPAELSKARRAASHYQTYSARPTPQRQATAPLPTRRLTKTRSPRPNLKNVATYSISSPIMSNAEATYKYCELIDPAELTARASQFLAPRETLVRSPSPSHYSDLESKPVSSRRFASSHSVDRTSADEHSDSATETPHT